MKYIVIVILELIFLLFSTSQVISMNHLSNGSINELKRTDKQIALALSGTEHIEIKEFISGEIFGNQRIIPVFDKASWTFNANGTFTFSSKLSASLSGRYSRTKNRIELHGENSSRIDGTFSIDGTIILNGEDISLDALYATNANPQQIVRLSQKLTKGDSIQHIELQTPVTGKNDKKIEPEIEKALEIEKKIEGITVPAEFSVSIQGKTNKGAFGPIEGMILVNEPDPASKHPLSFFLIADLGLHGTNGWISLTSGVMDNDAKNIQIQAKDGKVDLQINHEDSSSAQYTLGKVNDVMSIALIKNGTMSFSFEGNRVVGEIKASGMQLPTRETEYISDFKEPSFYEAKIVGEIRRSQPVEELKKHLKHSFNGEWESSENSFHRTKLQQNEKQVHGTYSRSGEKGEGIIQGVAQGNLLDFTLQENQAAKKQRGFFRAVNGGGTLVGLVWGEDQKGKSLTVSWQLPSFFTTENFTPFDFSELKYLGQDLVGKKKREQAVLLLDEFIKPYLPQQQISGQPFNLKSVEEERKKENSIVSTLLPLNILIYCYFQLGDYENLIKYLKNGMDIVRFLGPEESASRLFKRHTARLAEYHADNIKVTESYEDGYRALQDVISGNIGLVGVHLEQDETTKEVFVSQVEKGRPAELAGILLQDRVVKINGLTTHGLELDEVLDHLRGKAGDPVTITITRNQQEKSFHLVRAKVEVSSPQRQAELLNSLQLFADSTENLRRISKESLTKLNILAENIARGKQDPVSALQSVPKDIEQQISKVKSETNAIVKAGEELFHEQEEVVKGMEFIFSFMRKIENASNIELLKEADEREKRMMQLIETDHRLSWIEKDLFKSYWTDVTLIHASLSTKLEIEKKSIKQMEIENLFKENKKRSQYMTVQFADMIEMWRKRLIDDISIIQGDAKRIDALDKAQPVFEKAINFLISLDNVEYQELAEESKRPRKGKEEALVTCEKAKARAFADLLESKYPQKVLPNATDDLKLNELPDIPDDLSTEAYGKMMKNFSYKSSSSVTLENLLEIVKKNGSTVVEYFLMNDQLIIWVISPDGKKDEKIKTKIVPIERIELEATIHKATCLLSSPKNSEKERKQLSGYLHRLYQILILPIENLLPAAIDNEKEREIEKEKVITLIPHGQLFKVPFGALVTSLGNDTKRPKYFIEAHPLAYSPSIEILNYTLQNEKQGIQTETPNFLALVNPTGDHRLTERDVNQFNQFYPDSERNSIYKGKNATKDALTTSLEPGDSYTTLYFGTHGVAFDEKPLESYLALSRSHLTAADILDLDLKTDLVVTGACQTALGKITGDGVNGLSRAFTYAGAPSLLISLWSVPEEQTLRQIIFFHQYWLKEKYSKAQALREAQMEILSSYPEQPDIWAGFILFGGWQ